VPLPPAFPVGGQTVNTSSVQPRCSAKAAAEINVGTQPPLHQRNNEAVSIGWLAGPRRVIGGVIGACT